MVESATAGLRLELTVVSASCVLRIGMTLQPCCSMSSRIFPVLPIIYLACLAVSLN